GRGSVYFFVKHLERLSSELYYLGSPILEYTLKCKLYMGLDDKELRGKLDDYVSDPEVSFKALKKQEIASNLIGKGRDIGVDRLAGSEKDRLTLLGRVKSPIGKAVIRRDIFWQ
ncbi:hypothetical protein FOZ62_024118, partial [Perkinsus olseni]